MKSKRRKQVTTLLTAAVAFAAAAVLTIMPAAAEDGGSLTPQSSASSSAVQPALQGQTQAKQENSMDSSQPNSSSQDTQDSQTADTAGDVQVTLDTVEPYTFTELGKRYTVLIRTKPDRWPAVVSSNPSAVTVSNPTWNAKVQGYLCTLTAVGEGNAQIQVQAGHTQKVLETEVKVPPVQLWTDTSSYTFHTAGQQYTVLIRTSPAVKPIVVSSDTSVVTTAAPVWNAGAKGYLCTLTAVGEGNAQIQVQAGHTQKVIETEVKIPPVQLWTDTSSYTFHTAGQQYTVLIRTSPATKPIVVSSDTSVVTAAAPVWNAGAKGYLCKLTAVNTGNAQIQVQAGHTQKVMETEVKMPPVQLWTDTSSYTFHTAGQQYTVLIRTSPAVKPIVVSSDTSVVTAAAPVWNAGAKGYLCKLTAVGEGDAEVAVRAGSSEKKIAVRFVTTIGRDTLAYTFHTPGQTYHMGLSTSTGEQPQIVSSDPDVVKVVFTVPNPSHQGFLLCKLQAGEKEGTADITITAGRAKAVTTITNDFRPVNLSIDTSSYTFYYPGQRYTVLATVADNTPAIVSSEDLSVVSQQLKSDGNGRWLIQLVAQRSGETKIHVRAGSSEKVLPVKVSDERLTITANASGHTFYGLGQSYTFLFHTSHNLAPQFSSSNNYVAVVQNLGWNALQQGYQCRVTSRGTGSASISAYIGSAARTSVSVSVVNTDESQMRQRAQQYSSSTKYLFLVNTSTHRVGVYTGQSGNWGQLHYWACTTGASATPTIHGVFHIQSRGYYFDSGSVRCFYYTQIYGGYMFHSVLYAQTASPSQVVDGRLGQALSHGCIRLQLENARWIYMYVPFGTTVVIY